MSNGEQLNINQIKAYLGLLSFLASPTISKVPEKVVNEKKVKLETYKGHPTIKNIESDWFYWMVQYSREKKWVTENKEEYTQEWFDHVYEKKMTDDEIIEEFNRQNNI